MFCSAQAAKEEFVCGDYVYASGIKMKKQPAAANDWKTTPMPEAHAEFVFHRSFTPEKMELLRMDNIPQNDGG